VTSGHQVVLDACVLVNAALRDTLLRIAEPPRLYLPRWSKEIMDETVRTLEQKLGLSRQQTSYLVGQMTEYFPDCWIEGYEPLIASMTNDIKDRHVAAAAVRAGAETIVTFNIKHFQPEALSPWSIEALTPDEFLVQQFHRNSEVVLAKLAEQAAQRGGMKRLLEIHGRAVPEFTNLVRSELS
jgi:predicted nucleic acid-binding protein